MGLTESEVTEREVLTSQVLKMEAAMPWNMTGLQDPEEDSGHGHHALPRSWSDALTRICGLRLIITATLQLSRKPGIWAYPPFQVDLLCRE